LVQPGHIFPIEAKSGGVLVRNTLTDAALDCSRLLGHTSAAAYCDCLNAHGSLSDANQLIQLAQKHQLPYTTISEIVKHRLATESLVTRVAEANLPTALAGMVRAYTFSSKIYSGEHLALVKGDISGSQPVLTRVQAEATFSDVFGGSNSLSQQHLHKSLEMIGAEGRGVLLYLRKSEPGELTRNIRTADQPPAENSQASTNYDNATMRQYGIGAQILRDLGISQINLLTSKSGLPPGIFDFGLTIAAITPLNTLYR
jgi:3,4-dihydroxy 2-butanone 4-phosphate synthase/GTP cyclohydrolase II